MALKDMIWNCRWCSVNEKGCTVITYLAGVAIDSPMDHNTPVDEFVVAVNMPHCIWPCISVCSALDCFAGAHPLGNRTNSVQGSQNSALCDSNMVLCEEPNSIPNSRFGVVLLKLLHKCIELKVSYFTELAVSMTLDVLSKHVWVDLQSLGQNGNGYTTAV